MLSVWPAAHCRGTAMHSDALLQVGEAAQVGAPERGLAGPGGLEKTTLPLVL